MRIAGLQKVSLIDYPGKIACTLFTFGCNFRCGFCHNPELVLKEKPEYEYSEKEILEFLEKRKKYLDGVCITGGEPLIHSDIGNLLKKIKGFGYSIKLDTNGSRPDLLSELIKEKLIDFVAMDVKSDKEGYDLVAGRKVNLKDIEKSFKAIANSGIDYEFRTTVVRGLHNPENLKKIGEWLCHVLNKKPKKFVIQNFVARKENLIDKKFEKIRSFEEEELQGFKEAVSDYFEKVEIRS